MRHEQRKVDEILIEKVMNRIRREAEISLMYLKLSGPG